MFKLSENIDPNKVFIVNRSELEGRIDPIFYASDLAKFNTNIFKSVLLKSIVKYFKSGFGAGKQEQTDAKKGIIQIRPTNIDENGFLKYDKNIYLPIDKNSIRIEVDDILFNNTNSQELVGKTAILKENKELTFSNHITIIRVRKEAILPDYLWIILNMYQRNRIFYSICTNWNNQSGIGLELLKKLKVPLPPLEIQKQIVDLYEKAYTEKQQKEAEAQRLLDSIDDYLLGELGITLPKEEECLQQTTNKHNSYNLDNDNPLVKKGRLFLTNLSEVTGKRIDPYFYKESFKKAFSLIEKSQYPICKLKDISEKITSGITPLSEGDSYTNIREGIPFIRSGNIDINGNLNFEELLYLKPKIHNTIMKSSQLKQNDLIVAIVGATIGRVGIYLDNIEANINQAIALIRLKQEINPEYMKELINSSIGQLNLNRLKRPVARANINLEELATVVIVVPPLEKQNEIATHISQIRNKANALKQEGKEILEQAKQEVEQMILGN